ncbi:hypothetical protein EAH81_27355 [Flavobacterium pectinovorum]|uniref:Uncharacterized protein n=1 Tax=Flavobacterium pectinovorum TaxID=29533 RepID=A0A502DZB0_9FLAO|nr:hypothetical protein EAH81_27355 [Flavobacterium pectinovorum]
MVYARTKYYEKLKKSTKSLFVQYYLLTYFIFFHKKTYFYGAFSPSFLFCLEMEFERFGVLTSIFC